MNEYPPLPDFVELVYSQERAETMTRAMDFDYYENYEHNE